jgi:hypothetical protein
MTEIILSGTEETLKPVITLLVGIAQLLENKDIGQFVGEPLVENVRSLPHTSRLKLILYSVPTPPWRGKPGEKLIKAEYQIPDINPRKITWDAVKNVCGGSNGFMWGRFVASANLSNGRQMQAYGATAQDADNMLERMLSLTTAEVLTFGVTELKKEKRRAPGEGLEKKPTRVYPAYFSIINSKRINKIEARAIQEERLTKVKSKLAGDYVEKGTDRIALWKNRPPANFREIMNNALNFSDE